MVVWHSGYLNVSISSCQMPWVPKELTYIQGKWERRSESTDFQLPLFSLNKWSWWKGLSEVLILWAFPRSLESAVGRCLLSNIWVKRQDEKTEGSCVLPFHDWELLVHCGTNAAAVNLWMEPGFAKSSCGIVKWVKSLGHYDAAGEDSIQALVTRQSATVVEQTSLFFPHVTVAGTFLSCLLLVGKKEWMSHVCRIHTRQMKGQSPFFISS